MANISRRYIGWPLVSSRPHWMSTLNRRSFECPNEMILASDFSVRTVTCTSVTRVSCVCICGRSTGPSPTPRPSTAETEQTSWPLEKTSNCSETQVKLCWRRPDPLLVLSENTDACMDLCDANVRVYSYAKVTYYFWNMKD